MNLYLNDNKNYKIILNGQEYRIASYKEIANNILLTLNNEILTDSQGFYITYKQEENN